MYPSNLRSGKKMTLFEEYLPLSYFQGSSFLSCATWDFILVAAWDFLSWLPPPQALVAAEVASFGGIY